jgi:hypothetical protein
MSRLTSLLWVIAWTLILVWFVSVIVLRVA